LGMDRGLQVLLLTIFVAMLGLGIVSPIMPLYAETFGATYIQVGLLSSVWSISRFIFSTPAGRLSDSTGKKKVIMSGLLVYSAVSLLYTFAWDFNSLLFFRFIHGIGSAMASPVAMAYAAELAPRGEEGKYMGTMSLAMFGGMGVGPLIGGTLTDTFSLSAPFYVMCGLTALSLAFTAVYLPESRPSGFGKGNPRPSFRKVLSNKILLAGFMYRAVNSLGNSSIMGFLSLYMASAVMDGGLGLTVTEAGTVLSVGQVAGAFMQQPCGNLADRYNKRKLIILGGIVSAVGMASFTLSTTFWGVMLAQLIFAAGSALISPSLSSIAAIEGRQLGAGTTMSVLDSAMSLGMVVGPLLSGVVADMYSMKPIFYMGSAISLLGVGVFWVLQRGYRETVEQLD
jgi:DHA1 family multidrug resistance protein-like MFS transporter